MRQFFALACQHMRWQLNDLARRLDERPVAAALPDAGVPVPPSTGSCLTPDGRRALETIEGLPDDEREVFDLVPGQRPVSGGRAGGPEAGGARGGL